MPAIENFKNVRSIILLYLTKIAVRRISKKFTSHIFQISKIAHQFIQHTNQFTVLKT